MAKKSSVSLVNTSLGIRLSTHEKLCAERMKHLIKSIDELNRKVSKLSDDVSRGKGAVAVLIGIGTIIAACIGYFSIR
jgi:hypothetical protein|tara:strand:+ start:675 stop:908 length:234 start_codon:yes stop_codon:yes gene_type:complete